MKLAHFFRFCLLLSIPSLSSAAVILVTSPSGFASNGALDWNALGSPVTYVHAPVTTAVPGISGLTVTLSEPGDGWVRLDQSEWNGNFPDGSALLYTLYTQPPWPNTQRGGGPVTFDFNRPVQGFLIQVQNDYYGPFSVQIDAYDGTTLLATYSDAGVSCGAPGSSSTCTGGSPPWIGVHSDLTDITSLVLSTGGSYGSYGPNDFAFAGPLIEGTPTPEPATVFLLAACFIGICARARRRRVWSPDHAFVEDRGPRD